MFKSEALEIVREKIDKNVIFNDLIELSEEKTLKQKIFSPKAISVFSVSLLALLLINYLFINNSFLNGLSSIIIFTFLLSLIPASFVAFEAFMDYLFDSTGDDDKHKKFYSSKKIEKELAKHYSFNNKMNSHLNNPLSLKTYQYLATLIEEDDLKEIASFNLTYEDLDMENHYRLKNATVKSLEKELKDIEQKNKNKEEELIQIEKAKQKEKKKKTSDVFVSSLYKRK